MNGKIGKYCSAIDFHPCLILVFLFSHLGVSHYKSILNEIERRQRGMRWWEGMVIVDNIGKNKELIARKKFKKKRKEMCIKIRTWRLFGKMSCGYILEKYLWNFFFYLATTTTTNNFSLTLNHFQFFLSTFCISLTSLLTLTLISFIHLLLHLTLFLSFSLVLVLFYPLIFTFFFLDSNKSKYFLSLSTREWISAFLLSFFASFLISFGLSFLSFHMSFFLTD